MNLSETIDEKNFFDEDLSKIIQKSKVIINFHSTTSSGCYFLFKTNY